MSTNKHGVRAFAQRISNVAIAHGDQTDADSVEDQINAQSKKYLIPKEEAARLVCNSVLKELSHSVDEVNVEQLFSPTVTALEEVSTDGSWPTVVATVTGTLSSTHESIEQKVKITDGTSDMYVTQFTNTTHPKLEQGNTYILYNVLANEYDGRVDLVLANSTLVGKAITQVDPDNSYTGVVTDLLRGSGLIERCTHDDCSRLITDGTCDRHGPVKGEYDLRLKCVLDTGTDVHQVTIGRELTENITEFSLEDAVKLAEDEMNSNIVAEKMKQALHGRYLTVQGPTVYESIQADTVKFPETTSDVEFSTDSVPQLVSKMSRGAQ